MSTRTAHLVVRFTPEELALVKARARACRSAVARYIRESSLGHAPRPRDMAASADTIRTLNRIALDLRSALAADPSTEGKAAMVLQDLHEALHTLADIMRPARHRRAAANDAALE